MVHESMACTRTTPRTPFRMAGACHHPWLRIWKRSTSRHYLHRWTSYESGRSRTGRGDRAEREGGDSASCAVQWRDHGVRTADHGACVCGQCGMRRHFAPQVAHRREIRTRRRTPERARRKAPRRAMIAPSRGRVARCAHTSKDRADTTCRRGRQTDRARRSAQTSGRTVDFLSSGRAFSAGFVRLYPRRRAYSRVGSSASALRLSDTCR